MVVRHLCGTVYHSTVLILFAWVCVKHWGFYTRRTRRNNVFARVCGFTYTCDTLVRHSIYELFSMNIPETVLELVNFRFLFHHNESQTCIIMTKIHVYSFWWVILVPCWQPLLFVMFFQHRQYNRELSCSNKGTANLETRADLLKLIIH